MDYSKPYSHQAREWINDLTGLRECILCPRPLIGWGETLRHADEAVRPAMVPPAHAEAVDESVTIATRALEAMLTDRCTDQDRARRVVEALYEHGRLNASKSRRPRRKMRVA